MPDLAVTCINYHSGFIPQACFGSSEKPRFLNLQCRWSSSPTQAGLPRRISVTGLMCSQFDHQTLLALVFLLPLGTVLPSVGPRLERQNLSSQASIRYTTPSWNKATPPELDYIIVYYQGQIQWKVNELLVSHCFGRRLYCLSNAL